MDAKLIQTALKALGQQLPPAPQIELLIVGGAAGLLSGELSRAYTTSDVDALKVFPPEKWDLLQDTAAQVGRQLNLPANWLNNDVGLFSESLPKDWERRRLDGGRHGALQVWIVGRLDLMAMKFFSHRDRDIDHLRQMNVSADERKLVLDFLNSFTDMQSANQVAMAKHIVNNWDTPDAR